MLIPYSNKQPVRDPVTNRGLVQALRVKSMPELPHNWAGVLNGWTIARCHIAPPMKGDLK